MRDTLDQGGLAKPKDEPPVGIDLARYRAGDKPRDPLVKPETIKAGAANLWDRIRDGAEAFADWTIDVGERADIPARVEAMEIPRRSRELAAKTGELTARAARAVGRGSAKASRAAARASRRKRVTKPGSSARAGLMIFSATVRSRRVSTAS